MILVKRVVRKTFQVCVVVLGLVLILWLLPARREIYLADGGSGFLVLNHNWLGRYRVADESPDNVANTSTTVSGFGYRITITHSTNYGYTRAVTLTRSFWRADWFLAKIQTEQNFFGPDSKIRVQIAVPHRPIRYLHGLADENVVGYFKAVELAPRQNPYSPTQTTAPLVEIASRIVTAHRKDLYARVLLLDAASRCNFAMLKEKLNAWRDDFKEMDDPLLSSSFAKAQRTYAAYELAQQGENGYAVLGIYQNPSLPMEARLKEMCKALQMPHGGMATYITELSNGMPLNIQVMCKVIRTVATLMLFQGRRGEARDILASNYRIGQWLSAEYSNLEQLIGAYFRNVASNGLSEFALNACETHEEFAALWTELEELNRTDQARHAEDPLLFERNVLKLRGDNEAMKESEIRENIIDTRFQLVRMATAAKDHFITTGKWPASDKDFTPLLPNGPSKDAFSSETLRSRVTADAFYCYSVGPDGYDDRAQIDYDPTNGTISGGDLVTTITRERQYPFPGEAVRSSSPEDLAKQFPNGLPADVFANTRVRGLSVSYFPPITIYSYGPDTDQNYVLPQETIYIPSIEYDPTNGTLSRGDIFITLREK